MRVETERRRRKTYTEPEIEGLRQVAEILRQARLSQEGKIGTRKKNSVRGFIDLLKETTGEQFGVGDIQRYESAGELDQRYGFIKSISPDYLDCVAPFTDYTVEELKEMISGKLLSELPSSNQSVTKSITKHTQTITFNLSPSLIHFIETHRVTHNYQLVSQVIETALEEWRDRQLEKAYREASAEVDGDWDVTIADGLTDEAW
jgi:antitoxin ParD1/3/4